ncbi:serine/threonine-protein kinase [Ramlibacter sp. Leaf400]|uniref:serine/threonine-protein kinase n=1 Tax=Ramlibacter sp. Leaf400 TaxID=1736365 RepID=UPI0006F1D8C5|nr:serine/threonine-protein kinase [Ramlibacter sp. Leaf400]KQT10181.1 hypothetical protein ASG30_10000 [Ramlibacter sp. Leaf400]
MHLKKLGRYDLVRVLGKGAMGVVYEALDPNLDRQVAIKTIMVDGLGTAAAAEYEERFRIEARSAARLQHPNIVSVYDSDRDGDTAFLVMEFVSGDDLKQLLDRGGRYEVTDALHLVHDLLAALDYAHRQGVVHRDIKPANLLVEVGGRLKLTDFGVARIAGESTRTQGSMIGTLKYMAPEQVQGLKVDARADLFSAAVVTYQMLTGSRPFDGDNDFSVIHQVLGHAPAAPSSVVPELPPAVDIVMARALAKNRDERFATAAEFWQGLRGAFPHLDLPAMVVPQAQPRVPSPTLPGIAPLPSIPSHRAPTIPGAPITQELELEYWRDVRDATDPRELEGFLQRFPEGIYADLARRRLQRLATPESPDLTMLRGMTRVQVPPVAVEPSLPPSTATMPLAYGSDPSEAERAWQALRESQGTPQEQAAPAVVRPVPASDARPASMPRAKPALPWVGAAAALAGVGLVAILLWTRSPGADAGTPVAAASQASTAPTPATPSSGPAAQTSAQPANNASTAATAASPVASVKPSASGAARPASTTTPAKRPAPTPTAITVAGAPAAAPAPVVEQLHARVEEPGPSQTAARAPQQPRLVPPSETCKDKMFLMKEFCLQTECARPGYQAFPACVRLKEEARLRDESRVRN